MYRMEQDLDTGSNTVCSTCLSSNRNVFPINNLTPVYQIFRLLMYNFVSEEKLDESINEMEHLVCWECMALMKKFAKFKEQVQCVQEHIRVLSFGTSHENTDHTYLTQSLSSLRIEYKTDYDRIYLDSLAKDVNDQQKTTSLASSHKVMVPIHDELQTELKNVKLIQNNLGVDFSDGIAPENVLENSTDGDMSNSAEKDDFVRCEIFTHSKSNRLQGTNMGNTVQMNTSTSDNRDCNMSQSLSESSDDNQHNSCSGLKEPRLDTVQKIKVKTEFEMSARYFTEYMTEQEMLASREEDKQKVKYASSVYKCELCIVGFYSQQQVEDHYVSMHKPKPGREACKVCYAYIDEKNLLYHVDNHYMRYICKMCGHVDYNVKLAQMHTQSHLQRQWRNVIKIGDVEPNSVGKTRKKKKETGNKPPQTKPGDLRKLLSKTTIEGYQCLECDMFFKSSGARKNHVARFHREGYHCDHCKKRFVNRTTLTTHLKLHEGPLPRQECPICHNMVRVIHLKYHIQRHQNKSRYECTDCNKVFSHLTTFQGHLKYSRAHASDQVLKFPCPMCNKGYPTKEAMQDHFNYQHLGKTSHKCPVCEKPIASKANVERHMMRVHGEKKEKPKKHVCAVCGKGFTDKKALTQHEVIHSGERPLSCDLCPQTFKQKASLYNHKKRVHKVFPNKRVLQYMETTAPS